MSLLDIMVSGGWLMIPIALCSVVVIALGVSRFLLVRRNQAELAVFLRDWENTPATTNPERFTKSCEFGHTAVAEMADVFTGEDISHLEVVERVESIARAYLFWLEKGLGTMATLAGATPLIGFLGTVTGMIRAFMQIQNLGGNVNANVLAGGIWEALVTTAAGLAVGIVALIVHNYLAGRVRQAGMQLEQCGDLILKVLWKRHED